MQYDFVYILTGTACIISGLVLGMFYRFYPPPEAGSVSVHDIRQAQGGCWLSEITAMTLRNICQPVSGAIGYMFMAEPTPVFNEIGLANNTELILLVGLLVFLCVRARSPGLCGYRG